MRISALKSPLILCAVLGASMIAVTLMRTDSPPAGPSRLPAKPEPPAEPATADSTFEKTADSVTLGTGFVPPQTDPELERIDALLRRMAAMPEGEAKMQLAQEIARLNDRRAIPVLLNWATATTDRAVLRSALSALAPMGDAAMIEEIRRRYAATRSYDDRYRLGKIIANIGNPEAVPDLIALAESTDVPSQLAASAADALATIGTPPAVSLLLQRLESLPPDESQQLETTIARINRAAALSTLQFAAQGNKDASSIRTRIAAIQALANFSDQQTAELLAALSRDSVAEISDAAKSSLGLAR